MAGLLSPFAQEAEELVLPDNVVAPGADTDWPLLMARAQAAFPDAAPRRLMLPKEEGAPLALRLKQDFEWTPNGRTYVAIPRHPREPTGWGIPYRPVR